MEPNNNNNQILTSRHKQVILRLLALGCLLVVIGSAPSSAQAAVNIRPTIFLNSPAPAQNAEGQQPAPSSSQPVAVQAATAMLADAQPASTRIQPFKSRLCSASNGARLDSPLGLQSLAIDQLSLTASSHSNEQVAAHFARLNLDVAGGAWCPMRPISPLTFGKEWIQVKLNRSFVITAVETQGRFGAGAGKEFAPSYQVEYSRNGGSSWHKWKDVHGSSLLRANEDVNSAVRNELSPPIVGANAIRLLPYSQHLRTVCLRLELHGCPYDEGAPIAYSAPDGVVEPRWGHLVDYTYDGFKRNAQLSNGLGQLVDGVKGPDNFSYNNGFEWVGWKSMNGDVVIEFAFKTLRNFTGALFHSNNLFSSGVEVFQGVDVQYGIDVPLAAESLKDTLHEQRRRDAIQRPTRQLGSSTNSYSTSLSSEQTGGELNTLWSPEVLSIEYEPDKKVENSRQVTVHLKQRLANRLRFVLKFASKWILVSEVEFLSHPVELMSLASLSENHTPELIAALTPAKTYDQYVAILREHQLRRIASNAIMESPGFPGSSVASDASDQPETYITTPASPGIIPAFPPEFGRNLFPFGGYPADGPSTNPLLNQPHSFGQKPPSVIIGGPADDPTLELGTNLVNYPQHDLPSATTETHKQVNSAGGLATVITFVLIAILVFLGLLFVFSTYRLKQQPKLASHLTGSTLPSNKFIANLFAQSNHEANSNNLHHQQQQQQQQLSDNYYDAIYATGDRHLYEVRPASTLKQRLATLTGGGLHKGGAQTLLNPVHHQHQLQHQANQLLVSVKDSPNNMSHLFAGGNGGANKANSQVYTQLIVGLNQANPLAQQQIYNNMNCSSNQTYATHYSTSMSMASSSTATGRQDDNYAIPDAQPMISPLFAHHHHQQQQQQQQQQHMNLGFTSGHNKNPIQPPRLPDRDR